MQIASVVDFVDTLEAAALLESEQLEEVRRDLQSQHDDPQALSQSLVKRGWLTAFQAEQILQGHGRELVLGPYRFLELLGQGGMGQVYKAVHTRLQRVVALKIIRQDCLLRNPVAVRRFRREAQAAAQLSHPNVVVIYDADEVEGTHFIAMEYVEGTELSKLVQQHGPLAIAQACDYIRQAAMGLQHAHERGLVHRDIKPSNLLVSGLSDKASAPSWGTVKILDMGLARLQEQPENKNPYTFLTESGVVMGTPDFIAPEQARNASNVDIRSDLYSLGCTFYFLLTGLPPFPQGTLVEKLLMHQLDEPLALERLRSETPPEICRIVRTLMAKRPEDRFQTPLELTEALANLDLSEESFLVAQPKTHDKDAGLHASTMTLVTSTPEERKAELPIIPAAPAQPEEPAKPEAGGPLATFVGHRGWVTSLAFSPNGKILASGGVDETVRLRGFQDESYPEQVISLATGGDVHALAFSPDNQTLATVSSAMEGRVVLWDLRATTPQTKAVLKGQKGAVEALAFVSNGKMLVCGGSDKIVHLWDVSGTDPREKATLKGHTETIQAAAFAPDGKTVATAGGDGSVRIWSLGRIWSAVQAVLWGHAGQVRAVAFSPDGKMLASGGLDQTVRLWDLADPSEERALFEGHQDVVRIVLFDAENHTLLSVGDRGQAILWDLASSTKMRDWPMPGFMVNSVAVTPDGRCLAVGKSDGSIAAFNLKDSQKDEG